MRKFKDLRDCIRYRMSESTENYYYVQLWEEEVKLFCNDLDASILFIQTAITDEELYWLSEVFSNILLMTKSWEVLSSIRTRASSVQDQDMRQEIQNEIEEAAGAAGLF